MPHLVPNMGKTESEMKVRNCTTLRVTPQFLTFHFAAGGCRHEIYKHGGAETNFQKKTKRGTDNNSPAYIHMLWSYYLGQVDPLEGLLSGPTLLKKHCLLKSTTKTGVSAHFLKTKLRGKIWGVIIWAELAIFMLQQTWPRQWPLLGPAK